MNEKKKHSNFIAWIEKYQVILIPVITVLMSFIVASVIIMLLGKNPLTAFVNMLQGSGFLPKVKYAGGKSIFTDFLEFVDFWTPLIFASLSVAVALKAGMFNIGVSGMMLTSGFIATITIGYTNIAAGIAKPLVLVIGVAVGMGIGGFVGFLKYKFNINEVVSTVMLNYIAEYIISFFIITKYIDPLTRQSKVINESASLTIHSVRIWGLKFDIPLAIIVAVLVIFLIKYILDKTVSGYEIKAIGLNKKASLYAGINVKNNIISAFTLSGALAGMAGVTYYLGYLTSIQPKALPDMGFNAIAVAVLGNSNPVGVFFSSLLISIIGKGSTYMSSSSGLDSEIASVISGLVILFSACGPIIKRRIGLMMIKQEEGKCEDGTNHC